MKLEAVRKLRGMPFLKRGMKVYHYHNKKFGIISGGNNSGNLNIKFDDDNYSQNCHPKWEMKYIDKNGVVVADYHD